MRCLRSITAVQQNGAMFLSSENVDILEKELQDNFRMTVEELNASGNKKKIVVEVSTTKPIVTVPIKIQRKMFQLQPRRGPYPLELEIEKIEWDKYRITATDRSLTNLKRNDKKEVDITSLREEKGLLRDFTHCGNLPVPQLQPDH